jgi:hypothetical protein
MHRDPIPSSRISAQGHVFTLHFRQLTPLGVEYSVFTFHPSSLRAGLGTVLLITVIPRRSTGAPGDVLIISPFAVVLAYNLTPGAVEGGD